MENCTAIVLAAGRGSRMGSAVKKQYMELKGYPVLYYSLKSFEECAWIRNVVLVTAEEEITFCRKEIVERYGFQKVISVVKGGEERYDSVYRGLLACPSCDYVFIHDGARPLITQDLLLRGLEAVRQNGACVAGMPVKDTVKMVDDDGIVTETPDRSKIWAVQTPQVFSYRLILESYESAMKRDCQGITDDGMIVENYGRHPVSVYLGSYENLKITTPEDMVIALHLMDEKKSKKKKKIY